MSTETDPSPSSKADHFGSLDGLRGLAVLAVVWHHAGGRSPDWAASYRGFLGVDLFFVISGFLITTLLLREKQRLGRIHLGAFYARRALRLMPLYFAVLGFVALVYLFVVPGTQIGENYLQDLPWYATYTSNWIVSWSFMALTWSLALEEQFYLTWPALLRWAPGTATGALMLVCGASLLAHGGLLDPLFELVLGPQWQLYSMLVSTLLPLGMGCWLGLGLASSAPPSKRLRWVRFPWATPLALTLLLLAACAPLTWHQGLVVASAQFAMLYLVAGCVVREDHLLAAFLRHPLLRSIGKVSYGIYLLHMLAIQIVFEFQVRGWIRGGPARFACTAALATLLAAISYRFLESPFLRLRDRFRPEAG